MQNRKELQDLLMVENCGEIYISTDVEADGPCPGLNSMLSIGAAAYTEHKELVSTFSANLETLPSAKPDPDTMAWWNQERNRDAWFACRTDTQHPAKAMKDYVAWVEGLNRGTPVFVGYPAGYDWTFVYYYLCRFVGKSPFSFSALDIKSYAMAVLNSPYRKTTKKNMPKEWFDPIPHTHIALDDAIEQGALFCNILRYNKTGKVG